MTFGRSESFDPRRTGEIKRYNGVTVAVNSTTATVFFATIRNIRYRDLSISFSIQRSIRNVMLLFIL